MLDELDLFDGENFPEANAENSAAACSSENTIREVNEKQSTSTVGEMRNRHSETSVCTNTIPNDDDDDDDGDDIAIVAKLMSSFNPQEARKQDSPTRRRSKDATDKHKDRVRVEMPTKHDILCGQSRVCASHAGNRYFQDVLDDFAPRYHVATSKQEKMVMTKDVVATIHSSGGRFLKFKDGAWEEISTIAARDKVSHALRTKVASWKRQQEQMLQGGNGCSSLSGRRSSSRSCKLKHRKGSRRSSASSVSPRTAGMGNLSFDTNDSSGLKVNDMLKSQREFFESLTTPTRRSANASSKYNTEAVDIESHPEKLSGPMRSRRSSSYF